jgi:hypothetical protein
MIKKKLKLLMLLFSVTHTGLSLADNSMVLNISVDVTVPPPCVINNNQTIDVNFGNDLMTTHVDGSNYLKTIDYTISCTGVNSGTLMKMTIIGTASSFDSSAIQSDQSNLGIALRHDEQPLIIGQPFDVTYPALPVLKAVPVKKAGSTLVAGAFSAGATLVIDVQ